jgi:hypothetical protein
MFDEDNHSNGVGLQKYREMNGKPELLKNLITSEEVPPYNKLENRLDLIQIMLS